LHFTHQHAQASTSTSTHPCSPLVVLAIPIKRFDLKPARRALPSSCSRLTEHFETAIPEVDHMAFITSNLDEVERQLRIHRVFYKRVGSVSPCLSVLQTSIRGPPYQVCCACGFACPVAKLQRVALNLCRHPSGWAPQVAPSVSPDMALHHLMAPQFNSPKAGIAQIFVLDPDHNVLEISNCAPPVGETVCPTVKGGSMGGGALGAAPADVGPSPRSRL
jgi:hypothetical protein